MLRKIALASIAAASFGAALAGVPASASAEPWGGPRYGYGGGYGHHYGPPPWVRRWHWRRHHHYGPPAHHGPRPGHYYGRPVPPRQHW
jgi:hypothetical protein